MWSGSMHDARNLSCVTCHTSTARNPDAQLKSATVIDTCVACHKTEVAKTSGPVTCRCGRQDGLRSCHNPHGSTDVRMLKAGNSVNDTCVSCHAEKRGPFLWDHAPVREACNTCHDPHGSNNDRLLVAKLPMLCPPCHIGTRHPSTIYDGAQLIARSNRLIGRGCVNCHSQIHGSNSPAGNASFVRPWSVRRATIPSRLWTIVAARVASCQRRSLAQAARRRAPASARDDARRRRRRRSCRICGSSNFVDFGVRGTDLRRELRRGPVPAVSGPARTAPPWIVFRFYQRTDSRLFNVQADTPVPRISGHVGVIQPLRQGQGRRLNGTRCRSSTVRTRRRSTPRPSPGVLAPRRRPPSRDAEQHD